MLQSDFGLADGAVCAMRGIIAEVSSAVLVSDLTHDIPAFARWDASYRLFQTYRYWPAGTVFVSVVDPGVGSGRKSAVAKLIDGKYVVTPDNGTLCHLKAHAHIAEVREIDETKNRIKGSERSHTFHGRDVYAYTAGRLAAEAITFEEVGRAYDVSEIVELPLCFPTRSADMLAGSVDIIDVRYGNVWSNVPADFFEAARYQMGDTIAVTIASQPQSRVLYADKVRYGRSFSDVAIGDAVVYVNSLHYMAIAINQGNFAEDYHIDTHHRPTVSFTSASNERVERGG